MYNLSNDFLPVLDLSALQALLGDSWVWTVFLGFLSIIIFFHGSKTLSTVVEINRFHATI